MTDKLNLKLGDKVVEVTMDDNGRYSLNDIFRASGSLEKKKPYRFLNDSKRDMKVIKTWENKGREILTCQTSDKDGKSHLSDFDSYVVQTKINRATVTFAPLEVVYKYAAFISKDFEKAVFKAFTKLSTGDVQEAANIASSVTITPEIIAKHEKLRANLASTIKDVYGNNHHKYINYFRLIGKVVTGYTPKELTGGFDTTAEYIVKDNHLPAMNALIECERMILTLLKAGVKDYHTIAAALGVSTSKNKELLAEVNL